MESKNYYDILEVSVKASAQEITLAKNKLAKRYHPDVNMRNGIDTTDAGNSGGLPCSFRSGKACRI